MKKKKIEIQSLTSKKYLWAFKMFLVSICMSLFLGFISQTILTKMGIIFAIIVITIFVFLSVIFDMLGIAVASADLNVLKSWEKENKTGASVAVRLCENSEKVCSFCADMVGDICSTLSGAGGACIVVAITNELTSANIIMLVSIITSALIAGITIFFKAIMKERALKNSNKIILDLGKFLNKIFKF